MFCLQCSQIKCLTRYRATHPSVSDALLNIAYTEQSIVCTCVHVYVRLQCTSRMGKGSPRCTIDEIAIYNDLQCTRIWLGSQFSYEAAGLQVS